MRVRKYIAILFVAALCLGQVGCKKDKMLSYDFGSGIVIYKNGISEGRDSLTVSFAIKDENVTADTIELPLRIVGHVSDRERPVEYAIITEKTTAASNVYELLPAIIPANSYEGVLRIRVNKTEELKTKEAKVWIQLLNSTEFQVGPKEQMSYLVKVNNYLTKPSSWNDIRFGEYSQTKYRLIIRETGYSNFSGLLPEVLLFIATKCRNALSEYLIANDSEMLDENQVPVRFP